MFVCSSPNVIVFEMYIFFSHFLAGGEQKTFTSPGQAAKLAKLTHLVTVATLVGFANLTISLNMQIFLKVCIFSKVALLGIAQICIFTEKC